MEFDYIELIKSGDPILRNRAAFALGKRGLSDDRTVEALLEALKDMEWRVRSNAAKAIARIEPRDPMIFDYIVNIIGDDHEGVRIDTFSWIAIMLNSGFVCDKNQIKSVVSYYYDF